jgi:hypothetical protein
VRTMDEKADNIMIIDKNKELHVNILVSIVAIKNGTAI